MTRADIVVVGAGAAGMAAAIFARRLNPARSVLVLDGAKRPGAKILVSGGSRCNVTNVAVSETDFWGGPRPIVRRVLRAFPADAAASFFHDNGVPLHEEEHGKLFPDSNRSRDVLDLLLRSLYASGAQLEPGQRVIAVERSAAGLVVRTGREAILADAVVLATGGLSLPKTGSDGFGLQIAARLGHAIVPTTPALVPLVASPASPALSGIAHDASLTVWTDGRVSTRLDGALLWTHFGISGPAALDASRHWLRAALEGRHPSITVNLAGRRPFDQVDDELASIAHDRPRATLATLIGSAVPGGLAAELLGRLGLNPEIRGAHLARDDRRRIARFLVEWPVGIVGSRGYNFAEATAGGVALTEMDPATMESRRCPGLFFAGEMLDVDGRLGGFNFQWAWSSAYVAATGVARRRSADAG